MVGKVYNGYSIISNNCNEEFVSEDSIYILNNGEYHKVTESGLENNINNQTIGILNTDFERRSTVAESTSGDNYSRSVYYYPRGDMASYSSIINADGNNSQDVYEYFKDAKNNPSGNLYKLAQIYYTALGRERYGMYRVTNKLEDVQEYLRSQ